MTIKGQPSISIPKFNDTVTIDPQAIMAPDAPISENAQQPADPFLNAVKDLNTNRHKISDQIVPNAPEVPPVVDPNKPDTTPPVFKTAEEKTKELQDADVDDDEAFEDPMASDEAPKPSKQDSIKALKKKVDYHKNTATQLKSRTEELQQEIDRLKEYEEQIAEVETLRTRVKELESYEKIFDIHNNPEFQERYVQGEDRLLTEAKGIAAQYQVAPQVIDHALKLTNRKDLNDFLKKSGLDEYGVPEIRQYVLKVQELRTEREKMEKSPQEARELLATAFKENETRRVTELTNVLKERSNNAWNQITGYYARGENAVEMLKDKPGDPEHSERRSIVNGRAEKEFQKIVGSLVGLGVKDIPAPLAQALAARCQFSEWFGEAHAELKVANEKITTLEKKLAEHNKYSRPSFNGTGKAASEKAEINSKDVSSHVFMSAQNKLNSQPPR